MPVAGSETEGRAGKQLDGPAKTREVKLVLFGQVPSTDKAAFLNDDPGSIKLLGGDPECGRPRYRPLSLSPFARRGGSFESRAQGLCFRQARPRVRALDRFGAAWNNET